MYIRTSIATNELTVPDTWLQHIREGSWRKAERGLLKLTEKACFQAVDPDVEVAVQTYRADPVSPARSEL